MKVNGHTPIQEAIGRMLFGIENVPPDTARRMVSQTARMVSEYVSAIEADRDRLRGALKGLHDVVAREAKCDTVLNRSVHEHLRAARAALKETGGMRDE